MAGKDDFTIETKLKISGVEAVGKLDAGTLRFKVDTSALQKLVQDAAKAATRVKKRFDNIKLNKINIELNQSSLRSAEAQIRKTLQNAVGKIKLDLDASVASKVKGDPFKEQRAAAVKSASSLTQLHDLTKQVNSGLRSLIGTLSKFDAIRAAGGAGVGVGGGQSAAMSNLPLPASARVVNVSQIDQEIQKTQQLAGVDSQWRQYQLNQIFQNAKVQMKADEEHMNRIRQLKGELNSAYEQEKRLVSQLAGAGGGLFGGGTGGRVPPGGFGSFPGGGGAGDPRDIQMFAASIKEVTARTKEARKGMEELDELSFLVGRKAAAFRGVAIAINTIVDSVQGAVAFMVTFSDSLLELNKILQISETGLKRIGDQLFRLAADSGVSVDNTIAIAQEFARAGLEGRGYGSVVDLTSSALRGLQGTTLDASQASLILIQVIQQIESGARGLNKELITSGKLFDILGRVEDITAAKAQDFAEAFRRSGASLVATGASIEEIAGLISVVQERTQRGGEVIGTAFKTIATRVSNTSSEAAQALKGIGVAVVDSSGKLRNINDILRDTSIAFESLTEAEQAEISTKVAGLRQIEIFRNTVVGFNRVLEVQRQALLADGDAARKQAIEQQKLGTILERIKIGLQALVKTASEGAIGKAFSLGFQLAEKFLGVLNLINESLGGVITSVAGIALGIGAVKILRGLFSGMLQTLKFFVHDTKEGTSGLQAMGNAAKVTKVSGIDPMNKAFGGSVELIQFMNKQMQTFQLQTQLAAVQAERLAKARSLAARETTPEQLLKNPNAIDQRTKQILSEQGLQDRLNRRRALKAGTKEFGAGEVNRTIQAAPGIFSEQERAVAQRRANIEESGGRQAFFNQRRSLMGKDEFNGISIGAEKATKGAGVLGKSLTFLGKHTLAVGLTAGVAGSLLGEASRRLEDSGHSAAASVTSVAGNIAQFAGLGALFGPWGIAIGGIFGAITGLIDVFGKSEITIQSLQKEYEKLGIVQRQSGEISDAAAKMIEEAFKDIDAFTRFQAGKAERVLEERLNPEKAKQRQQLATGERENLGRNILAAIDLGADKSTNIESLRKLLGDVSKITSSSAAGGFSFQQAAVTPGSQGVLKVSAEQAAESINLLKDAAEKAGGKEGLERMQAIINEVERSVAGGRSGANRLGAQESIDDLARILRSEIPPLFVQSGRDFVREIDQGAGTLAKVARGDLVRGTKEFEEAVGALRERVGKGTIKGGEGTPLTLEVFDKLLARAASTGERALTEQSLKAGGAAGIKLGQVSERALQLIEELAAQQKQEDALANRRQQLLAQSTSFGNIGSTKGGPSNIDELIKPVDNLGLALRHFADEFHKSSLRLSEATLRAMTPQDKLTEALGRQAQIELDAARKNAELVKGDVIARFQKSVEELTGGAAAEGIDQKTGAIRAGFDAETAKITKDEIRKSLLEGVFGAAEEIRQKGIIDPEQQRKLLGEKLQSSAKGRIDTGEFDLLVKSAGDAINSILESQVAVATAVDKSNLAQLAILQKRLAEEEKAMGISERRRDVLRTEAEAELASLTGLRRLSAERAIETKLQQDAVAEQNKYIASLDELLTVNKARLEVNADDVDAQNQLKETTDRRVDAQINLEKMLAEESANASRARLDALQEFLTLGQREVDFLKTRSAGTAEINNLLRIGGSQLDEFNNKLNQNTQQFRLTQAELAAEIQAVNLTIQDETSRKEKLVEIQKRGAEAAIEAAKAEAEIIAERRNAVKQITSELLSNQDQQVQAQKAVIDATKNVSEAYMRYNEAVRGAILASTQYNINLRLAQNEANKVTGAFTGVRQELAATQKIFGDAERSLREMGAGEKALVEIRRQSITQQLSLFTQLLNDQSSLAKSFFQSSAQDQADLFRGIQEAGGVADILGGSFDQFKKLGESAINDLGAQLLALPQETRQRVVSSLETLKSVGGSVGGFSADELLTAIQTASLGVSQEGLQVDPLFEVQQKIASLTEEQARLATDQLIAANEQVKTSKESLDEAVAQKDLAEIQLDRIKEEGSQLRGKLAEVSGNLNTTLIQQDATNRNGFNLVAQAIQRTTDAITTMLPSALSASLADSLKNALAGTGFALRGVNATESALPQSGFTPTPSSKGVELARAMRESNANVAEVRQQVNTSGPALGIASAAISNGAQNTNSNIGESNSLSETNQRLADIAAQLTDLNKVTTSSNEALNQLSSASTTPGTTAAATVSVPDINVNIQGQQQVTVTGFESGVQTIIAGLIQTFGSFVTETEARNIANEVVEAIRVQLERLNIIQRNQL